VAVRELNAVDVQAHRRRGHFTRAMYRLLRKKIAVVCIIALLIVYSGGVFAAWVAPNDYQFQDYNVINKGPIFVTDSGLKAFWTESHFAGTDRFGRDMFTRVLWGIQNTVILTIVAMLTGGLFIGVTLGLLSGYAGGKVDAVIMRTGEIFGSFPDILLAIILAATLRPRIVQWVRWVEDHTFLDDLVKSGVADYVVISLALVSFGWIGMARLVRGQILVLKETQHVESARAIGASTPRILFRHLLPNAISPVVVSVSMGMGSMVGVEIILSWLGIGIQPPRPSLGLMLFEGGVNLSILRNWPWLLLAPGIASWLMVLSWNLLGDALNDVLNPRTR
jgi:ABC-type dipeptide/oligopeptide/nickel transport system permease subunit